MAMKFLSILKSKNENPLDCGPATIGFLGDSVTNGCFEVMPAMTDTGKQGFDVVYDQENSYTAYLRRILTRLYPYAQLNVINAGISGDDAPTGLARIDRDLLKYRPDLVTVCYGLNDVWNGSEGVNAYRTALDGIFKKISASGAEAILLTPQPVCARVHSQLEAGELRDLAKELTRIFSEGIFDQYMQAAREAAAANNVPVCDCYKKWMIMYDNGVDITDLLANYLNHPARDMHWLFANSLAETIFTA